MSSTPSSSHTTSSNVLGQSTSNVQAHKNAGALVFRRKKRKLHSSTPTTPVKKKLQVFDFAALTPSPKSHQPEVQPAIEEPEPLHNPTSYPEVRRRCAAACVTADTRRIAVRTQRKTTTKVTTNYQRRGEASKVV